MKCAALTLALTLATTPLAASDDCTQDAMIVFDGSGSMAELGFNDLAQPRIIDARAALHRAIPSIARVRRLGLTIYGPGDHDDTCRNITRHFAPVSDAASRILSTLDALAPAGPTPLTQAVAMAAETLEYRYRAATILLVTDGKETCGGATCQLANHLSYAARDLTVHVIGFKVRADHFDWNSGQDQGIETVASCLADATDGTYVSTETVDELTRAMTATLGCPVYGARVP